MPREYINREALNAALERWQPADILAPMSRDDIWHSVRRMIEDRERDVFDAFLDELVRRVKHGIVTHLKAVT